VFIRIYVVFLATTILSISFPTTGADCCRKFNYRRLLPYLCCVAHNQGGSVQQASKSVSSAHTLSQTVCGTFYAFVHEIRNTHRTYRNPDSGKFTAQCFRKLQSLQNKLQLMIIIIISLTDNSVCQSAQSCGVMCSQSVQSIGECVASGSTM
jgi:hypothetical protein